MITCIRDVRRARKMTLQDVADRCTPPTTPQTIGRLETGTRTLSVVWLNRIALALNVEAADLVSLPDRGDVPIAAVLGQDGARAPRRGGVALLPQPGPDMIAISVACGIGDYRSNDEIWCRRIGPADFASVLNRDLLVPRPAGRFLFGRLIGREEDKLHLLPPGAGTRQLIIADPQWAAVAVKLIRTL
ncbi:helix-turn-helix domain-containing protein [Sphingosinicella rhizophila]|uniref:Helix-turn-helix transcriptional regulator n=1 Tax=Sphingosinicella rhizophila TaxID=3050082 RepID=A0ABU3Q4F4_9SPHN|nr:helix-turn-helix transcriptional regulator [Sphingosinicella sp. GR2756]MDT9598297.1 helix-turn-helix transcriptional regulator [Sphingosinicella sp. GR2756]